MLLDVFLFQAEGFRGVQDEHLHADVGGHARGGGLRDEDHEQDRQRHGPDGGLLADPIGKESKNPKLNSFITVILV